MNADEQGTKPTPPRDARQIFVSYLKKTRHYYDEANEISAVFLTQADRFGSEKLAEIAATDTFEWRQAVANQQFTERLANLYGQAAVLNALENIGRVLEEQTKLLRRMANDVEDQSRPCHCSRVPGTHYHGSG